MNARGIHQRARIVVNPTTFELPCTTISGDIQIFPGIDHFHLSITRSYSFDRGGQAAEQPETVLSGLS